MVTISYAILPDTKTPSDLTWEDYRDYLNWWSEQCKKEQSKQMKPKKLGKKAARKGMR